MFGVSFNVNLSRRTRSYEVSCDGSFEVIQYNPPCKLEEPDSEEITTTLYSTTIIGLV